MSKFTVLAHDLRRMAKAIDEGEETETQEVQNYRKLLMKLKGKGVIGKLNLLIENPRVKKNDLYWSRALDNAETSEGDITTIMKGIKKIIVMNTAVAPFLKKILDFGIENGVVALARILSKNRVRMTIMKEDSEEK